MALKHRGICFEEQKDSRCLRREKVGLHRLDLVVEGEIVLELKAVKALEDIHFAQLKSCLRATALHVGLLLNFALVVKRVVF